jgi:predicted molibdopterin-dependent oxidoreductase YjgC
LIELKVNNKTISAEPGTTIAAAILNSGIDEFRRSVSGESRAALCGMGTCFECRVTISGVQHQRSCNEVIEQGMEILTDA